MKNTGTHMTSKTRRNMIARIRARALSGEIRGDIAEQYIKSLLTEPHPGVTRVMAYGFHPTK